MGVDVENIVGIHHLAVVAKENVTAVKNIAIP